MIRQNREGYDELGGKRSSNNDSTTSSRRNSRNGIIPSTEDINTLAVLDAITSTSLRRKSRSDTNILDDDIANSISGSLSRRGSFQSTPPSFSRNNSNKNDEMSQEKSSQLDLTALTNLRRKSRSSASMSAEMNTLSADESSSGLQRRGSFQTTPPTLSRSGSKGSVNGVTDGSGMPPQRRNSNSNLKAILVEQAISSSTSSKGNGERRLSFEGDEPSPTVRDTSVMRRHSRSGAAFGEAIELVRGGSVGTGSSSSLRLSRSTASMEDINTTTSSSGKHSFESKVIAAAQTAMQQKKGRSIASIIRNPSYGRTAASTKRGITSITHNICIGGRDDAKDIEALRSWGITHVLNVAQQLPNYQEGVLMCMKIPLEDAEDVNILKALPQATAFIEQAENAGGRVLVHCISGVSRSPTIVMMHLMNKHGIPLKDTFDYIQSCRPWITPNDGFKLQLASLEVGKFGCSSVAAPNSGTAWQFYAWNAKKASLKIMTQADKERITGVQPSGCVDVCVLS